MKPVAQPIKLLIVNLVLMRNYFRPNDSITKEQFDLHFEQVKILVDMLSIPKLRYNITKKLNEKNILINEECFVELIKLVEQMATDICGISQEDIDDSFTPFWNNNKNHASQLYIINTAPKVNQAYEMFLNYSDLINSALEDR